jgi:hypothetical protein
MLPDVTRIFSAVVHIVIGIRHDLEHSALSLLAKSRDRCEGGVLLGSYPAVEL